jgi:hypothetical protein
LPTYQRLSRFDQDFAALTREERERFIAALEKFVADLRRGRFRAGLRVRGIEGAPGIFDMTWAPDGRATFEYRPEVKPGEPHIIWRRVGGHDVFAAP